MTPSSSATSGRVNGTRLNREFVKGKVPLTPGAEIGIGPFRLVFDGSRFVHRDDRGALRLTAEDISTVIGDKTILNRASITVEPGEFVVIIGASGSGKTTLVKALAGVTSPSGGEVKVSGEPVATRLTDIGYVPQDEIVHRRLTVEEALRFSAALRLPQGLHRLRRPRGDGPGPRGALARRAHRDARRVAVGRAAQARRGRNRAPRTGRACCCSTSRRPASTPASRRG